MDADVLIIGAGPTGLVLPLWLTALDVRVRIVDRSGGPGTTSRALGVQARTLELYRQLGLADAVAGSGHRAPAFNLWAAGRRRARIPFDAAGADLTPYPFLTIYPQDEHERLLVARLERAGIAVQRRTELISFREQGSRVIARLRDVDGREEAVAASYLAGCDGARSTVRDGLGIGFSGGTYPQSFYVADVVATGPVMDGDIHISLDEASDFLAVFPLAGTGRGRLVGTVLDARPDRTDALTFADVGDRALAKLGIEVAAVSWFSTYRVHHRVADRFRAGRCFLLGDAGHIHSPAGGQGMNTGIGDAVNLAWKLSAVLAAHAPAALLNSYEAERIGFARRLVRTTDRAFTAATSSGRLYRLWRTWVAPALVPRLNVIPGVRRIGFRTVSQLALNYRGGPLSRGRAGRVRGGDRLPWTGHCGPDNHAPLSSMRWQVHVYGEASAVMRSWCRAQGLALHAFAWRSGFRDAGLKRDAAYLLRPDTYVAVASRRGLPSAFERVLSDAGLLPR